MKISHVEVKRPGFFARFHRGAQLDQGETKVRQKGSFAYIPDFNYFKIVRFLRPPIRLFYKQFKLKLIYNNCRTALQSQKTGNNL